MEADGPTRYGPRKRRKIKRSKSGCLTCRRRKKRCDMVEPTCGGCDRLQKECDWPAVDTTVSDLRNISVETGQREPCSSLLSSPLGMALEAAREQPDDNVIVGPIENEWEPFNLNAQPAVDNVQAATNRDRGASAASMPDLDVWSTFMPDETATGAMALPDHAGISLLDELFQSTFNDTMLQLGGTTWSAFPTLAVPEIAPFACSNLVQATKVTQDGSATVEAIPSSRSPSPAHSISSHLPLLQHYQASLSSLVSCTDSGPTAFNAFIQLATATVTSPIGQGLHLSTLAWAGRHMANKGQIKYEVVSDRLFDQANTIITECLLDWRTALAQDCKQTERMALLAAVLMLMQVKICRGDVWGFREYDGHLRSLSASLYMPESPGVPSDSMPFSVFENLVYHDVLSSFIVADGPLVSYSVLSAYARPAVDGIHTLMGACLPLVCMQHRIATLIRQRRLKRGREWNDEELVDIVHSAEQIEHELRDEKKRLDTHVHENPQLSSHRYLHEAWRIACLLQLRSFVLHHSPTSLDIRLLVRKSLSLLEVMNSQRLPGWCSAHWILFTTALCCVPGPVASGEGDERERITKLYQDTTTDLGFQNTRRSLQVVQEVWHRNPKESRIDWLDVLDDFEWELYLV